MFNINIMKTKIPKMIMSFFLISANPENPSSNSPVSYLIGGIIALLILGYLIYTLLRPDKF
jgi:K+-transporting ATPase KdpF subunit